MDLELIGFDQPSETRYFEKGRFDVYRIGPAILGRATYEPGWRWSEHAASLAGTAFCQIEHVGLVLGGQAIAKTEDGTERLMRAGDFFYVPPGHDSWVVGDEPYVSLHLLGSGEYAARGDDRPLQLRGEHVVLRPLQPAQVECLAAIQAEPDIARWWGPPRRAELRRQAEGRADDKALAIEAHGELVGLIQYYEENDPDYRHASIDIFLTARAQGRGLGADALRTLARYLIEERGHHRLTIDPAVANERAIRAYEKVGFRPVGVMRHYERGPDGTWRDGLLMDLLADDDALVATGVTPPGRLR